MNIIETIETKLILQALPLLQGQYKYLNEKQLREMLAEIKHDNGKFILGYNNQEIIAFATYWLRTRFYAKKLMQIDSLIVNPKHSGQNYGSQIIDYIENIAKEHNCQKYVLDVYVENKLAQKLYIKHGFTLRGFHMVKDLD